MNRSYLFVPADNERKLKKCLASPADAVILDLEDSVSAGERPRARSLIREFLQDRPEFDVWVRINPLYTKDSLLDLREVMRDAPDGIVLPKVHGASDVLRLGKLLDVLEQENAVDTGHTKIIPLTTEVPAALFRMHEYAQASARIAALTWGAEDLSAAVGALENRDVDGNWLAPYELARSLCLFGAAAAEVPAIDTIFADFRNTKRLALYAERARRDGFSGMLSIHPDQIAIINSAFTPTAEEVANARQIIALLDEQPGVGVVSLNGKMLDRPHLLQARKVLSMIDDVAEQSGTKID